MLEPKTQEEFNMRDHQKAEEIAAQRVQLLSPLLAKDLDAAKARQLGPRYASRPASPSAYCRAGRVVPMR